MEDGIESVRSLLPRAWIDNTKAGRGLECLVNYCFDYDDSKRAFKTRPKHDWTSHGCDALRMFAVANDGGQKRFDRKGQGKWLM